MYKDPDGNNIIAWGALKQIISEWALYGGTQ